MPGWSFNSVSCTDDKFAFAGMEETGGQGLADYRCDSALKLRWMCVGWIYAIWIDFYIHFHTHSCTHMYIHKKKKHPQQAAFHPGQVTSLWKGRCRCTSTQPSRFTFTPAANSELPISLTCVCGLWEEGKEKSWNRICHLHIVTRQFGLCTVT